jgi:signal transduction histidine kinase
MEVLQGEVERMRGILDEFLTFSRPLTPLTLDHIDPRALAARVVALHEGAARAHGTKLVLRGQARRLQADPRKLLQVLVNLVQNALAASSGGLVEVAVGEDAGRVVFTVADRGPGLDPALRDRVFSAGVTSKADGSGLGLTIALAIVRQHDGELALDDRDGGGTIARVTLP